MRNTGIWKQQMQKNKSNAKTLHHFAEFCFIEKQLIHETSAPHSAISDLKDASLKQHKHKKNIGNI